MAGPKQGGGFTLVEVLIALSVAVLIWGATASAFAAVLRMETGGQRLYEAALLARTLAVRAHVRTPDAGETDGPWRVEPAAEPDRNRQVWRGWVLDRPGSGASPLRVYLVPRGTGEEHVRRRERE